MNRAGCLRRARGIGFPLFFASFFFAPVFSPRPVSAPVSKKNFSPAMKFGRHDLGFYLRNLRDGAGYRRIKNARASWSRLEWYHPEHQVWLYLASFPSIQELTPGQVRVRLRTYFFPRQTELKWEEVEAPGGGRLFFIRGLVVENQSLEASLFWQQKQNFVHLALRARQRADIATSPGKTKVPDTKKGAVRLKTAPVARQWWQTHLGRNPNFFPASGG